MIRRVMDFLAGKTSADTLDLGGASVPLAFVRNRRARRYILRMTPAGGVRVTIPWGGSKAFALEFAQRNAAWVARQLQRPKTSPAEWGHGTEVLFRGVPQALHLSETPEGWRCIFAGREFSLAGPADVRGSVEQQLRALAEPELTARTWELAALHGLRIRRVRVGNQRSRWGSCSVQGTIALNWRLVQAPESVRDYIILHELMHLRQMNHSPRFWAEVRGVCPDFEEAECWLRRNARLLR